LSVSLLMILTFSSFILQDPFTMEILKIARTFLTKKHCANCNLVRMDNGLGGSFCVNSVRANIFKQWEYEYPKSSQPQRESVKKCDHRSNYSPNF